jgi:hypothetical protein
MGVVLVKVRLASAKEAMMVRRYRQNLVPGLAPVKKPRHTRTHASLKSSLVSGKDVTISA